VPSFPTVPGLFALWVRAVMTLAFFLLAWFVDSRFAGIGVAMKFVAELLWSPTSTRPAALPPARVLTADPRRPACPLRTQ